MTDSRAAWERVEHELHSSMADKEEQLTAMSSKLNSLEAEMSNLHASNDQLTQHNTDRQRLMADRETQSAQLKAQVGKKSSAIHISWFASFVSCITRTIYSSKNFPIELRLTDDCIYTWLSWDSRRSVEHHLDVLQTNEAFGALEHITVNHNVNYLINNNIVSALPSWACLPLQPFHSCVTKSMKINRAFWKCGWLLKVLYSSSSIF